MNKYKQLSSYINLPELFIDEGKAIAYLEQLNNSNTLNDYNYCQIDYELLIALKCHYYNKDRIQKLIINLSLKIYENYLFKQQYLKRLL